MADNSNRRVTVTAEEEQKKAKAPKAKDEQAVKPKAPRKKKETTLPTPATGAEPREGDACPLCRQGRIIRGKTAFGCSRWREGCTYRVPFKQ
jgi:DNA topoisomerase-3